MRLEGSWLVLDAVGTTQEVAADLVRGGRTDVGVVFAHDQIAGRGRFGRVWSSKRGESLTFSLLLWQYADWPRPWLIGMAAGIAVAETIDCRLRWPNDVIYEGLKTGGILTELSSDPSGRQVPVVGIGLNLLQTDFPPELAFATSIFRATGRAWRPLDLAKSIAAELARIADPVQWDDLAGLWLCRDCTPGKAYKMADGRVASAVRVGADGALVCEVDGVEVEVLAAEAIFGSWD